MRTFNGFSLIEVLTVISIVLIIGGISTPVIATYYTNCAMKLAVSEVTMIIKEARALAMFSNNAVAVTFNPLTTEISLVTDRGLDDKWNTSDDLVNRKIRLSNKAGIHFGYGNCGPVPGLANEIDGISFQTNNSMVCNQDMSNNAGTLYLKLHENRVTALTFNSTDTKVKVRDCCAGHW